MEQLNFPNYKVLIKNNENKIFIFDIVRKKWVPYTPEEWVRINCIYYLTETKGYPITWINIEKEIELYGTKKRFDIVVFDSKLKPNILIECKAPSVRIYQKTFDQINTYNLKLKCNYLMITNGINHYFCKMNFKEASLSFIETLPYFK